MHGDGKCECGNPSGEVKTCSFACCADCGKPTHPRISPELVSEAIDEHAGIIMENISIHNALLRKLKGGSR